MCEHHYADGDDDDNDDNHMNFNILIDDRMIMTVTMKMMKKIMMVI